MNLVKFLFLIFILPNIVLGQRKTTYKKPNQKLICADKHFDNGNYFKSAKFYSLVLESDSSNAYAIYQLAECQRFYKDYQSAELNYLKVIQRYHKKYPLARYWYAIMLKHKHNYNDEFVQLEKYLLEDIDADHYSEYSEKARLEYEQCKILIADEYFNTGQYFKSAKQYAFILKTDSLNSYVLYQLAQSQRLFNEYESAEINYLKVVEQYSEKYPLARFWYASLLIDNYKYYEAILNFRKYLLEHLDTDLETELYREKATQEIKHCEFLILSEKSNTSKYVLNCLPEPVNSKESDFNATPFKDNDNMFITISSSRSGSVGGNIDNASGGECSDIYQFQSKSQEIGFKVLAGFDKLNTNFSELSGSYIEDGSKFYFTRCDKVQNDVDSEQMNCGIYVSHNVSGKWEQPIRLNENINLPNSWNGDPSISSKGNILFFVSTRPGGIGLKDIWFSECDSNDQWKLPVNMGSSVNSLFTDISPKYYEEEGILFFASEGHGGLDVFMLDLADSLFLIRNIGYPFNSNRNDFGLQLGDIRGYLTSNRKGGIGKLDIYSFPINSRRTFFTEIKNLKTITEAK